MTRFLTAALVVAATLGSVPTVALAQDASQMQALMRPGASVFGSSGKEIGTIESIDRKTIVLKTADGPVTLSKGTLSVGVKGLRVDKTPSQIRTLAEAQAKPPAP